MLGESPRFRIPWRTVSRGSGEADDDFTEAVAASAVGAAGAAATGGIPLSDAARQTLHTIVERYGPGVVSQPLRVEGLLRDLCGECQREIVVLMAALTEDVPEELLAAHGNGLPPKLTLDRLAGRLQENCALPLDTGRWAVTAWAEALGVPLEQGAKADPTAVTATPASTDAQTAKPTGSSPRRRRVGYIILGVIVLAAIAFGGAFMLRDRSAAETIADKPPRLHNSQVINPTTTPAAAPTTLPAPATRRRP